MAGRWDRCVRHSGQDAVAFVKAFFAEDHRSILIIAGGGFDPRSSEMSSLVAKAAGSHVRAIIIREERPHQSPELASFADVHTRKITQVIPNSDVHSVHMFTHRWRSHWRPQSRQPARRSGHDGLYRCNY